MSTISKETVYDEKVFPLMKQIIAICKENGIEYYNQFFLGDTEENSSLTVSSSYKHDLETPYSKYPLDLLYYVGHFGNNVDGLIMQIMKDARVRGHGSMCLQMLGVPPEPEKTAVKPGTAGMTMSEVIALMPETYESGAPGSPRGGYIMYPVGNWHFENEKYCPDGNLDSVGYYCDIAGGKSRKIIRTGYTPNAGIDIYFKDDEGVEQRRNVNGRMNITLYSDLWVLQNVLVHIGLAEETRPNAPVPRD